MSTGGESSHVRFGPSPLFQAGRPRNDGLMKKTLIGLVVLVVVALVARRLAGNLQNINWEEKFDAMPDNAPPKWMFRNITAIRENTDRIIELLEGRSAEPGSASEVTDPVVT
jgi:hypothetical protein